MVQCDRYCIQFDGFIILNIPKCEVGSKVLKWGVKSLTLHYK